MEPFSQAVTDSILRFIRKDRPYSDWFQSVGRFHEATKHQDMRQEYDSMFKGYWFTPSGERIPA